MYNVQHSKTKLCRQGTKIPFHPKELALNIPAELIHRFKKQGGSVLDPFCRTMTMLIFALNISRHGFRIEKIKPFYDATLDRLIGDLSSRTRTAAAVSQSADVALNSKLSEAKL